MHITKISKGMSITINLGNYESGRFEVMLEAEVSENESLKSCGIRLTELVREQLHDDLEVVLSTLTPRQKEQIENRISFPEDIDQE